jgi:hypothetical protein
MKFYRQKPQPATPPTWSGCTECATNRVHLSRGPVSSVTSKVVPAHVVARCKTCGN